MQILGRVVAILNDDLILIQANEFAEKDQIRIDSEFAVFHTEKNVKINGATNKNLLKNLYIPKGAITVTGCQEDRIYLASIIKTDTIKKTIKKPSPLLGLPNMFEPFEEEVYRNIRVHLSEGVNSKLSQNIAVDTNVNIGDYFGLITND